MNRARLKSSALAKRTCQHARRTRAQKRTRRVDTAVIDLGQNACGYLE
jgi:hypothetical protein